MEPLVMPSWTLSNESAPPDVDLLDSAGQRAFASQFFTRLAPMDAWNAVPTSDYSWHDNTSANDYRMPGGLGYSRTMSREDSMPHEVWHGTTMPNKNPGRNSKSVDLDRGALQDRANHMFRKLGSKPHMNPPGTNIQRWDYDVQEQQHPEGSPFYHQHNRNNTLPPDADSVYRRLYQPPPSRLTKMLSTDVEEQGLRPNRTLMSATAMLNNDMSRRQLYAVPKNADVRESVMSGWAVGDAPRGLSRVVAQPHIWSESVYRAPLGSNDTGDKSVFGFLPPPNHEGERTAQHYADRLRAQQGYNKYVRGHNIDEELAYAAAFRAKQKQTLANPFSM